MCKYRRIPIVVDAFQMTAWRRMNPDHWPEWVREAFEKPPNKVGSLHYRKIRFPEYLDDLDVTVREGLMPVPVGYWLARTEDGTIYPLSPATFARSFQPYAPDENRDLLFLILASAAALATAFAVFLTIREVLVY